jgi:hypothetical protein
VRLVAGQTATVKVLVSSKPATAPANATAKQSATAAPSLKQ